MGLGAKRKRGRSGLRGAVEHDGVAIGLAGDEPVHDEVMHVGSDGVGEAAGRRDEAGRSVGGCRPDRELNAAGSLGFKPDEHFAMFLIAQHRAGDDTAGGAEGGGTRQNAQNRNECAMVHPGSENGGEAGAKMQSRGKPSRNRAYWRLGSSLEKLGAVSKLGPTAELGLEASGEFLRLWRLRPTCFPADV